MKTKLGKNQIIIFTLIGISSTLFYYTNKLILKGGNFSDGILVGFLLGLIFICSSTILFLWIRMIYLNWKVRIK